MKLLQSLAFAALALSVSSPAFAATWTIDEAHTTSAFEVTHLKVTRVRGRFGKTNGTVEIEDKDLTKSRLDITIDASSIDTRNAKRDAHLQSADFFDVAKHPSITFKSTKVEKGKGKDKLKVIGDLTIRGVTKPVTLDVTYTGTEVKTPWGTLVRGASAIATINRHDWGVSWNNLFDGGGVTVGDNVDLILDVQMTRPAEAPKTEAPKDPPKADAAKDAPKADAAKTK